MDYETKRADKLVKRFDKNLKAIRNKDGIIQICQNVYKWSPVDIGPFSVLYPVTENHYVFSLTDTWGAQGKGVSWGFEPIYQKMREISLDRRDQMFNEIEKQNELAQRSKELAQKSRFEDIARETRDIYKNTFKDVNTANMDKGKDVRKIREGIKNGIS